MISKLSNFSLAPLNMPKWYVHTSQHSDTPACFLLQSLPQQAILLVQFNNHQDAQIASRYLPRRQEYCALLLDAWSLNISFISVLNPFSRKNMGRFATQELLYFLLSDTGINS
jgi:hypothetical protein